MFLEWQLQACHFTEPRKATRGRKTIKPNEMFQGWRGRTAGNGQPLQDHHHFQGKTGRNLNTSAENSREGMTRFMCSSSSPGNTGDQMALADERGRQGTHQPVLSGAVAVNTALAAPASLQRNFCLCQPHLQCLRNVHCQQGINPMLLLFGPQRQIQWEQFVSPA